MLWTLNTLPMNSMIPASQARPKSEKTSTPLARVESIALPSSPIVRQHQG